MGTQFSVKLVASPEPDAAHLQLLLRAELAAINSLMSTWDPDSELSRFNASRSLDWFGVSPRMLAVLEASKEVSDKSSGAFDVTVGPLVNLWGFGPEQHQFEVPADADLSAAGKRIGYQRLELRQSPPAMRKQVADLYVDLSAVAKGYAVDALAELLEAQGISDYLVEIGGEIRVAGKNAEGDPWRIAVESPTPGPRTVQKIIYPRDNAVATSGDYRNFFEIDGRRYSHTIDPRTGRPVTHDLASVTVVHKSAMHADALATALLVLGPESGMAMAARESLAVLMIVRNDGGIAMRSSQAFKSFLEPGA